MKRLWRLAGLGWVSAVLVSSCSDPIHSSGTGGAGGGSNATGGTSTGTCLTGCGEARNCCAEHCVNLQNDPQHCGSCDMPCAFGEYCTQGTCAKPPCEKTCADGETCCGGECCAGSQLCCDPQGPLDRGPQCSEPNEYATCPTGCAPLCICASPDTPIATPQGEIPIANLSVGDLVYSIDHGQLKAVPVARANHTKAENHHVLRVVLANGRTLEISPRHPTATGESWGALRAGDVLDGVGVVRAELIPYTHEATYDILPASDTGTYFAGGVLIGSTLAVSAVRVFEPTAPASVGSPE